MLSQQVDESDLRLLPPDFVLGLIDKLIVARAREQDGLDQSSRRLVLDQFFCVLYVEDLTAVTQHEQLCVDLGICQAPCCLDADVCAASHDLWRVQRPDQAIPLV